MNNLKFLQVEGISANNSAKIKLIDRLGCKAFTGQEVGRIQNERGPQPTTKVCNFLSSEEVVDETPQLISLNRNSIPGDQTLELSKAKSSILDAQNTANGTRFLRSTSFHSTEAAESSEPFTEPSSPAMNEPGQFVVWSNAAFCAKSWDMMYCSAGMKASSKWNTALFSCKQLGHRSEAGEQAYNDSTGAVNHSSRLPTMTIEDSRLPEDRVPVDYESSCPQIGLYARWPAICSSDWDIKKQNYDHLKNWSIRTSESRRNVRTVASELQKSPLFATQPGTEKGVLAPTRGPVDSIGGAHGGGNCKFVLDLEAQIRAELEIEIEKDLEKEIKSQISLLTRRLSELHSIRAARCIKNRRAKNKTPQSCPQYVDNISCTQPEQPVLHLNPYKLANGEVEEQSDDLITGKSGTMEYNQQTSDGKSVQSISENSDAQIPPRSWTSPFTPGEAVSARNIHFSYANSRTPTSLRKTVNPTMSLHSQQTQTSPIEGAAKSLLIDFDHHHQHAVTRTIPIRVKSCIFQKIAFRTRIHAWACADTAKEFDWVKSLRTISMPSSPTRTFMKDTLRPLSRDRSAHTVPSTVRVHPKRFIVPTEPVFRPEEHLLSSEARSRRTVLVSPRKVRASLRGALRLTHKVAKNSSPKRMNPVTDNDTGDTYLASASRSKKTLNISKVPSGTIALVEQTWRDPGVMRWQSGKGRHMKEVVTDRMMSRKVILPLANSKQQQASGDLLWKGSLERQQQSLQEEKQKKKNRLNLLSSFKAEMGLINSGTKLGSTNGRRSRGREEKAGVVGGV